MREKDEMILVILVEKGIVGEKQSMQSLILNPYRFLFLILYLMLCS